MNSIDYSTLVSFDSFSAHKLARFADGPSSSTPGGQPACMWLAGERVHVGVLCCASASHTHTHTVPNVLGPLTHIIHITVDSQKICRQDIPFEIAQIMELNFKYFPDTVGATRRIH